MEYQNLLLQIKDHILTVTINRENKLNAINRATLKELHAAFTDASQNEKVKGIIITGSGPKAFIAGADISEFSKFDIDEGRKLAAEGHHTFNLLENSEKPVIAAINGYALGGGLELAMACHLRIASDTAKMGLPEINLGLIPGYGGTQRLTRLTGKAKALEMILTGQIISAPEALQTGLVNQVVSAEELISKANELALKIVNGPRTAITGAIHAVNAAVAENIDGFSVEIDEFAKCFATEDFQEGIRAFCEKRKPIFSSK